MNFSETPLAGAAASQFVSCGGDLCDLVSENPLRVVKLCSLARFPSDSAPNWNQEG